MPPHDTVKHIIFVSNGNLGKKEVSKPIDCLNRIAWMAGVCIYQQCATNLDFMHSLTF
jgi:hypothetical protein